MPPKLTPEVVADPDLLSEAVDGVIRSDPCGRRRQREIVSLQRQLRGLVSDEAWAEFLQLDALATARFADLSVVIAAWAFEQVWNSASFESDHENTEIVG